MSVNLEGTACWLERNWAGIFGSPAHETKLSLQCCACCVWPTFGGTMSGSCPEKPAGKHQLTYACASVKIPTLACPLTIFVISKRRCQPGCARVSLTLTGASFFSASVSPDIIPSVTRSGNAVRATGGRQTQKFSRPCSARKGILQLPVHMYPREYMRVWVHGRVWALSLSALPEQPPTAQSLSIFFYLFLSLQVHTYISHACACVHT